MNNKIEKCHFMEHTVGWGGDCYCCGKCGDVFVNAETKGNQAILYPDKREIVTQIAYDVSTGDVAKVTVSGQEVDYLKVGSNVIVTLYVHKKPLSNLSK